MNFRQAPSRWKNQILTAQKRDQYHSELDLTRNTIGNDGARTVQANHDTLIFSCGSSGVGFVPLSAPGKFGFQHKKVNCGTVSDLHVSPFVEQRVVAVSCSDQSVKVYAIPNLENEDEEIPALHSFRASAGTANTPVLLCWNPQVSGILAIASGTKVDIFSQTADKIISTIDVASPAISMDWTHDGERLYVISKDAVLRIIDPRASTKEDVKVSGTKHVVRSLPDEQFVISSLSKMREREMNLYHNDESGKSVKSWNFGTASTPLIPIVDTARKIVYLLDKSGGVLRWLETFAPYNEGAAGTTVDQSSSGCLIHPFGLQLMEGEINRLIIGDTKGNTVPIKISIGRKSYVEFHEDLYTPTILESSISAEDWAKGKSVMAKLCTVSPAQANKALKQESLSNSAYTASAGTKHVAKAPAMHTDSKANGTDKEATSYSEKAAPQPEDSIIQKEPTVLKQSIQHTQSMPNPGTTLSAREQRKWDREEGKNNAGARVPEVSREDQSARRAEYGASSSHAQETSAKPHTPENSKDTSVSDVGARTSPNKEMEMEMAAADATTTKRIPPALDDEDALEAMRARRVTPAVEQSQLSKSVDIQSPQPLREVYREDLTARRAEYGAQPAGSREVFRENLGERRAEYGATSSPSSLARQSPSKKDASQSQTEVKEAAGRATTNDREIYREDLTARRAEYGANSQVSRISPSKIASPSLSAREQRKWDKEEKAKSSSPQSSTGQDEKAQDKASDVEIREDGAATESSEPYAKPARTSTAEREVYREDLSARRAEYGATPKLDGPTQAYKEITRALGQSTVSTSPVPKPETVPYAHESPREEQKAAKDSDHLALENAYARPATAVSEKTSSSPKTSNQDDSSKVNLPEASQDRIDKSQNSNTAESQNEAKIDRTAFTKSESAPHRDYTRKYLEGKPQHVSNSYTSLIGLNASLPNTARMIDATSSFIIIPLAGPGGRLAIVPYSSSGRLPPLLTGFMGGTQVVDFELDRFVKGRLASAHADQTVKVWTVPNNVEELEADVQQAAFTLTGMDRILSLSFSPLVRDLLMVTTSTKIHLFDLASQKELSTIPARGIANTCWSLDGAKIAVGKSDKTISIIEARTGSEIKTFASAHQSSRPFRVQFVAENKLITAGFGSGSTRQLALYDIEKGQKLQVHDMDISPSPFSLPYFDEMSSILYLIPRGTSNILPFHILEESFVPLTAYSAADPIMGTSFLPPQELDTQKVEIARCLRLTTNEVSVVGFHIPRPAGDLFHDDIYPSEIRDRHTASLTVKEWETGADATSHKMINLNPQGLKGSSAAGVGSFGKKSGASIATKATFRAREPEAKKPSELEQMFEKAKGQNGDEPEYQNNAENTRWD